MSSIRPLLWLIPVYLIVRAILYGALDILSPAGDVIFLLTLLTLAAIYFSGETMKNKIIRAIEATIQATKDGWWYIVHTPRDIARQDRGRYRADRLSMLKQGALYGTSEHREQCRQLLKDEFDIEIETQTHTESSG